MSSLTAKQMDFCKSYIITRDAKASAMEAGYSESYANKKAFALLKDEKIYKKIEELEAEHFKNRFAKLAMRSLDALDEMLNTELLDERVTLAAIKEVFKYHKLEQKMDAVDKDDGGTQFNITFNEVASRDA